MQCEDPLPPAILRPSVPPPAITLAPMRPQTRWIRFLEAMNETQRYLSIVFGLRRRWRFAT
jgi:hypothetical protein